MGLRPQSSLFLKGLWTAGIPRLMADFAVELRSTGAWMSRYQLGNGKNHIRFLGLGFPTFIFIERKKLRGYYSKPAGGGSHFELMKWNEKKPMSADFGHRFNLTCSKGAMKSCKDGR
jgi:hypothetical protein